MSYTLTVSIGRNIGNEPMSNKEWVHFRECVSADIRDITGAVEDTMHLGTGVWDGVPEESAILSWFNLDLTDEQLSDIARLMSINARHFEQDTIAITYTQPIFA